MDPFAINLLPPEGHGASNRRAGQSGMIGADFETFLRMLTTQLQNQNPLNPVQASDFAVQLATFSGVEQQVQTNQLLRGLAGRLDTLAMAQLGGWIGREVRAAMPVVLSGDAVALALAPDPLADRVVLVVRDSRDREVAREALPPEARHISWSGIRSDGTSLPAGTYRLVLESHAGGTLLGTSEVEVYARISEARLSRDGGVVLVTEAGIELPADRARALR